MKFSHTFIDRPILAVVVSVFIVLFGLGALVSLPVAQYPEIVPPTIQVTTIYPGASADVVAKTVATPLEQQINGVENMLYMSSQSTGDGKLTITVTFRLGTDLNTAQVLTQNRVTQTLPRLPADVQLQGVDVRKATPNILLIVHLVSPKGTRDQSYLSNYATLHMRDVLARLPGVGDVQIASPRDYAMRIWIDPDKAAAYGLTATDVVAALRSQNVQVSAGVLNQPPTPTLGAFQLNVQALGRLSSPDQFGTIIIKNDGQGHLTRVRDVARMEVGAADYGTAAYLDSSRATPIFIYALPGANSLAVEHAVLAETKTLSQDFPQDVGYQVIYDPTEFIQQSVNEVIKTIGIAVLLVVAVVIVFLQSWQASLIPVVAIPVSLIGTMVVLSAAGFSLNNLSLFGVVLAVGIVVDDAIVVVENVERNIEAGMAPKEAAHKTMDEVGGAIVAIALTLCAVFLPSAFLSGISGQFFRQFAVTIAASTLISCFVSLTLSPALCALLFHARAKGGVRPRPWWPARVVRGFFAGFNAIFDRLSRGYAGMTAGLVRRLGLVLLMYAALIGLTGFQFARAPTGFIPDQDQSYLITIVQLPPGSTLGRTEAIVRQVAAIVEKTPGVAHAVPFVALDATTFTQASNSATVFSKLAPFDERVAQGLDAPKVLASLRSRLAGIQDASIFSIAPPPVQGLGSAGGFKMMVQDRGNVGPEALERATQALVAAANADPALGGVFTLFNTKTPSVYADIDRERAEKLGGDAARRVRRHAGLSGFLVHQRLQLSRPDVRGHRPGRRAVPPDAERHQPASDPQFGWTDGSDRLGRAPQRGDDAVSYPPLQPLPHGRNTRRRGARHRIRHGARAYGEARDGRAAARRGLRVDGSRLPGAAEGHADPARLRCRGAVRLPCSCRPVREPALAARGDPDRADVPARGGDGPADPRDPGEHPGAGRLHRPGRSGCQKCDPDRGIRAPVGRRGR